uniref:Lipoprotein n=1 Tax=Ascaris lumbricoides TaxID=6252 RepID=A0A0M3HMF6_ASCLU
MCLTDAFCTTNRKKRTNDQKKRKFFKVYPYALAAGFLAVCCSGSVALYAATSSTVISATVIRTTVPTGNRRRCNKLSSDATRCRLPTG